MVHDQDETIVRAARWRAWLIEQLATVTARQVTEHDVNRPLLELGISSRHAVALAARAGELLGRELPSTVVWTAPTIAELAELLATDPDAATGTVTGTSLAAEPSQDAVAVVGLACRFPGATTPGEFWDLLAGGRAAIGEVPAGRWERFVSDVAGHDLPRHGGFLADVAGFDAEFFGISPDEATIMDPQQRLLLEVAWEALAGAGIAPESLRGTDCGVFVGLSAVEYAQLTMTDLNRIEAASGTGAAASVTANRVSYALGVHGPSVTVDTACSSSLVAVHQAVRALVDGDASAALVGGVNLLLSPAITASFHRAGLLAEDGRCKPFDAGADGIVRGEGCGVVVLKRLGDATRDGDRILAVIKGSAVNSDGRSNGLMAPNPVAQQRVLARAYERAGVAAQAVDYVEAHGTGTLVGDPIEAGALSAVLGAGRAADRPLLVGSVKSNLGHLEGAAGIAGLIKVVLGLWHSRIPPSLNFTTPNPHIDFASGRLSVVTAQTDWPRYGGVARAGVSSFGFGGTNAHVVLEEWSRTGPGRTAPADRPQIVVLAERSTARLRARAATIADWLTDDTHDTTTVAAALAHVYHDAPARAAVVARDVTQLRDRLRRFADGRPDLLTHNGSMPVDAPNGPVFVFSGFGGQWPGMGRRLLAEEPAFAAAVTELDDAFRAVAGVALTDLLTDEHGAARISGQQLALFGMQVALATLWQASGVRPAAVLGHSMGEVAAAVVAGALTPGDGLRVMAHRTELLDELQEHGFGAMAAVELSPAEIAALGFDAVTVSVHTSPAQSTVSGPVDQVTALVARVEEIGRLAKILPTGVAGHSAAIDPLLPRLTAALTGLRPEPAKVACYTSVLDEPRWKPDYDADYWAANLRRPVRFTQAIAAAIADGHRMFVEVSPHPIAVAAVEHTASALGVDNVVVVPTSRRDLDGTSGGFAAALAALCVHGDMRLVRRRYPDRVVIDLPAPTWRHRTYWASARLATGSTHPVLGPRVDVPETARQVWRGEVRQADHAGSSVHGVPVLPGMAFVELMLSAAADSFGRGGVELRGVVLDRLLPLAGDTELSVSAVRVDGDLDMSVVALADGEWVRYATATAVVADAAPIRRMTAPDVLVPVRSPGARASIGCTLPPELAEACVQALAGLAGDPGEGVWLATRISRVRVTGEPRAATTVAAGATSAVLLDAEGATVAELSGVTLTAVTRSAVPFPPAHLAYRAEWVPRELPEPGLSGRTHWLVLYGKGVDPAPLTRRLVASGQHALLAPLTGSGGLAAAVTEPGGLAGVVVLPAAPGSATDPATARGGVLVVASVVRELTSLVEEAAPPRLWLVTSGAAAAVPGETGRPGLAALRGLVRVLAYEHPELRATLLDVDDQETEDVVAQELLVDPPEDEIAWRGGRRLVLTLARADLPAVAPTPVVRAGAYVITGGFGGLGIAAAKWLATKGATRLVLCARHAPDTRARAGIEQIEAGGVQVEVVLGDIAEPGVAERLVRVATRDALPLRGVLHVAGALADGAVLSMTAENLAIAWHAKTQGAVRLHEACAGIELDWWLAYSSAAALFGSPGQAAYATANAWLDAFVAWRRGIGLPAATIQWGAWAGIGAAAGKDNPVLDPMPPAEAIGALPAVLAAGHTHVAITRLRADAVLELFPALARRPFFAGLLTTLGIDATGRPAAGLDQVLALVAGDPARARATVTEHIGAVLAEMMWLDGERLRPDVPLTSLGMDSLLAMRARAAVERDFGVTLPLPLLLRGATLAEVAEHLVGGLCTDQPPTVPEPAAPILAGPGPRDFAERWVGRLVGQVLPASLGVGVHTPLTEVGLDDMTVQRLRTAISAELGHPVTTRGLYAVPTIAGIADALRVDLEGTEDGAGGERVVRLLGDESDGRRPPLYLFHAAGSRTAVYRPLAELLSPAFACHGMERLDHLDTVAAKAARYIELIRARQPSGPYRLGGWSFGGMLAFEVARQLVAAGARIELLFLVDTIIPLPDPESSPADALHTRLRRFVEYIEQTYQVDLGLPAAELVALPEAERDDLVLRRLSERVAGMGSAVLNHQQASYVDARISERYTPAGYAGPVLLFRAKDPHPLTTTLDPRYLRADDALGWDEFCPAMEIVKVPGDHITVIDPPQVSVIADRILAGHIQQEHSRK